jgi:hypothetical protein
MNAPVSQKPAAHMPLKFGFMAAYHALKVHGGPFDMRPMKPGSFNVCVRAERVPAEWNHAHLPIHDFEVPTPEQRQLVEYTLFQALKAGIDGKNVYVGCMGGVGRTGLFMALLAKTAGIDNPVSYVRSTYDKRSVETEEQKTYVARFDVSPVQRRLFWYAWISRAFWWL